MPVKSHGRSACRDRTYEAWQRMIRRCCDPKRKNYDRYGGRGIIVCDRWKGKDGFVNFRADMGERPEGMELDRENNDGNYEPGNCRWASRSQNNRNRRSNRLLTFGGVTKPLIEWAEQYGLKWSTLASRLDRGKSIEEALKPVKAGRKAPVRDWKWC